MSLRIPLRILLWQVEVLQLQQRYRGLSRDTLIIVRTASKWSRLLYRKLAREVAAKSTKSAPAWLTDDGSADAPLTKGGYSDFKKKFAGLNDNTNELDVASKASKDELDWLDDGSADIPLGKGGYSDFHKKSVDGPTTSYRTVYNGVDDSPSSGLNNDSGVGLISGNATPAKSNVEVTQNDDGSTVDDTLQM
ncbi:uncharacterized protein PHALS_09873 [Plasmopara halstedii]|uniref:Uncharacterized protein n=1 Tax=Plasmopara halstedii TaxID=4781 RepID=A0A0N7L4U3_PLAHL|nr:uncharacterized protein PHALS_09873 [Plasmopara halstedii]CEG39635.1 hypothetical protein PHALS_09873 [Plasmopara halstedii]|eukprot:XP_024576004.1 hypothetical protein PHALS_09873 [Plasmopara halstedii]